MNVKSGAETYIAYKNAVLILGIPPPEIIKYILPKPFRSAICCMQTQKAFDDMRRVMFSCIVQPLVHRSAVNHEGRHTVFSDMPIIMTNVLLGVNNVTLPILAEIMKSKFLDLIFTS